MNAALFIAASSHIAYALLEFELPQSPLRPWQAAASSPE
jgi:hypothetical protein